jgi:hypothetical protein
MISIYNETKGTWGMDTLNDGTVIRFLKSKERSIDNGKTKKRTISVITYTPLFDNMDQLKSTLANAKVTKEPVVLTEKGTAVIFNNKEFKPIINPRTNNLKDILFGSLFLGGKKIIGVKNDHTFLLEFFILGAEFSFISSFNSDGASFEVYLLNEPTNEVITYRFVSNEGKIEITRSERAATDADKKTNSRLKVFRPARPTNVILVHPKDREELNKTVDTTHYQVVEYTNLEEATTSLVKQNYKAVTLFAKSKFREETDVERKRYAIVIDKLTRKFQTVFKLYIGGKVDKVKF